MPPIQSVFGRATVLSMRTRQMQDRVRFEMTNIKQTRLKNGICDDFQIRI
nr:MAG TPA: hypothetical protein [Caudoviricetes sp.]